ncbi:MAG: hypothetical protein A2504_15490 [Bdellovibrionales bacterium RIFOXYD12_FULL_39_22]|nr:MAG: hypothetical protein A2385_02920 [Bdellovibrionales bacterium RIFOXYB1_FULL_39_21]OFZ43197.1 MAG: hypothetical protein A2485_12065 [Bdellovibrionales bacterium RIFOXYC12_FULL_39_17]OFZ47935.1 MAG: hypothetical protein A2404_16705 [Bdellovibrionales bacterium RIFOXYC1_FULL_39_130]OFZ74853.1 MAG: hypothetical protein A2451_03245 [Bdellovibrionales bacterium RIFOXYC2_FULL_39_8]OFZ75715.1 MAG: hypothetical protein A2560_13205 [Bdellovibrionales bacterium RIFOXYD1_FULL_39_84]OFZ94205.1 MAG:
MKNRFPNYFTVIAIIVFSLLQATNSFAAKEVPGEDSSRHRIEVDAGYSYLKFDETHYGDRSLDTNFNQESLNFQLTYQLFLISGLLYTRLDAQYIGVLTHSSVDGSRVFLLNGNGSVGLIVPGTRPLNLTLAAEYYYTRPFTSSDNFGADAQDGVQYYPLLDYTRPDGVLSVYFKYPLFASISNREEFSSGIIFRFLFNRPLPYPYAAFQHAVILKADFTLTKTYFEAEDGSEIKSRVQALTFSVGYNF